MTRLCNCTGVQASNLASELCHQSFRTLNIMGYASKTKEKAEKYVTKT